MSRESRRGLETELLLAGAWPSVRVLSLVLPRARDASLWVPLSSGLGSLNVPMRAWVTLCEHVGMTGVCANSGQESGLCKQPRALLTCLAVAHTPQRWLHSLESWLAWPCTGQESNTRGLQTEHVQLPWLRCARRWGQAPPGWTR